MISINVSRALCRETPNRRKIYYIKAGETIREGQVPCVSFHVQKVQVCGFMYLGTNHWLLVGMTGATSEAGEHNVGGTTESQPWKTGRIYRVDTCTVVPTLTAAGLLGSALEGGPFGGGASSKRSSSPGSMNSFLPLITPGLSHIPPFCPLCFFLPFIISVTNTLNGIPSPMVGFCFTD